MKLGTTDISKLMLGSSPVQRVMLGTAEVWSAFSPLSLAPALWLDAADASTLYDATSGGSLVAADGTVARWQDKSGNGRHLTQTTAGSRAQRKTSVLNAKDALLFDGTSDHFGSLSLPLPNGVLHWFGVIRPQSKAAYANIYDSTQLRLWLQTDVKLELNTGSGAVSPLGYTDAWIIVHARSAASVAPGHRLMVNGVTVASNNALRSMSNPTTFSFFSRSGGQNYKGHCGEQIWFTSDLTTQQITDVNQYLSTKWGII